METCGESVSAHLARLRAPRSAGRLSNGASSNKTFLERPRGCAPGQRAYGPDGAPGVCRSGLGSLHRSDSRRVVVARPTLSGFPQGDFAYSTRPTRRRSVDDDCERGRRCRNTLIGARRSRNEFVLKCGLFAWTRCTMEPRCCRSSSESALTSLLAAATHTTNNRPLHPMLLPWSPPSTIPSADADPSSRSSTMTPSKRYGLTSLVGCSLVARA